MNRPLPRSAASYRYNMSEDEMARHRRAQAEERVRRGFTGFTRPEVREAVLGRTAGESALRKGQRGTQVTYPKKRK